MQKTAQNTKTQVQAYSFDADNCLYNKDYYRSTNPLIQGDVIAANNKLLSGIKDEINTQNCNDVRIFIGSARQDIIIDFLNTFLKSQGIKKQKLNVTPETAVETIQKIAEAISKDCPNTRIAIEKMLMADITSDHSNGHAFSAFINSVNSTAETLTDIKSKINFLTGLSSALKRHFKGHSQWSINDETKCSIVYAQVHKLAEEFDRNGEKANIVFNFYDDREDITNDVQHLFEARRDLLPHNVTLNVYQYNGDTPVLKSSIKGTGVVDVFYRRTIRQISEKALDAHDNKLFDHLITHKPQITLRSNFFSRRPMMIDHPKCRDLTDLLENSDTIIVSEKSPDLESKNERSEKLIASGCLQLD